MVASKIAENTIDSLFNIPGYLIEASKPTYDNEYAGFIKREGMNESHRLKMEREPHVMLYTRAVMGNVVESKCDIYDYYNSGTCIANVLPTDSVSKFNDFKLIFDSDHNNGRDYAGILPRIGDFRYLSSSFASAWGSGADPDSLTEEYRGREAAFNNLKTVLERGECELHKYPDEYSNYVDQFGYTDDDRQKTLIRTTKQPYIRLDKHVDHIFTGTHENDRDQHTNLCEIVDYKSRHVGENALPEINTDFDMDDYNLDLALRGDSLWRTFTIQTSDGPATANRQDGIFLGAAMNDMKVIYNIHDHDEKEHINGTVEYDNLPANIQGEFIESFFNGDCIIYTINDTNTNISI